MENETHKTYIEMDTRMSWGKDTTGQKLQHSDFQGPNNASSTNAQHTKSTVKRQILSIIDLDWLVSVFIVMSKNHIDFSHRSYNRSLLFCYRVFLILFSAVWHFGNGMHLNAQKRAPIFPIQNPKKKFYYSTHNTELGHLICIQPIFFFVLVFRVVTPTIMIWQIPRKKSRSQNLQIYENSF